MQPVAALLPCGQRLHLHHGPIDLIIGVDGDRATAFDAAQDRFATVLSELTTELPLLRATTLTDRARGAIARRMQAAIAPCAHLEPVTPMAAVAGSVAQEILAAMTDATNLTRAYVNNGGDIAIHLTPGTRFTMAMAAHDGTDLGRIRIAYDDPVRGIATSGRHGRSHSLGIADSVAVLAPTASAADVAATLIANAVDLPGHPAIRRTPANQLTDDSDLGARPVVTGCGALTRTEVATALSAGLLRARMTPNITAASLHLAGQSRSFGAHASLLPESPQMPDTLLRKTILTVEEIFHEGGPAPEKPLLRGAIVAVLKNPYAGAYVANIQPFMDDLKPLGLSMATKLAAALGGADRIEGYGKGALIGEGGEIEHGALWHAPGGYAMRELLGDARAIVPSTKKVGGVGMRLDVPVTHINASYVRGHFDAMEVGCNDAPRADEMAVVLVMTTGARIHNRAGGLDAADIKGEDGLR